MENEKQESKPEQRGQHNFECFIIQIKSEFGPRALGDLVISEQWRNLPIESGGKCGIGAVGAHDENRYGYMTYNQAKAIEHKFHSESGVIGLRSRLVKYKGVVTYSFSEVGPLKDFDGYEPQPSVIPEGARK